MFELSETNPKQSREFDGQYCCQSLDSTSKTDEDRLLTHGNNFDPFNGSIIFY